MPAIRSGDLRHLAIFERRTAGNNEYGEPTGAWAEVTRARVAIDPLVETQEIFQALQLSTQESSRIRCRYKTVLASITTTDRITVGAAVYDIRAVIEPNTAHKEMNFLVERHRE